ncbi:MAG: hypothetical protein WCW62_11440, partial [Bacteroidales bacterium]
MVSTFSCYCSVDNGRIPRTGDSLIGNQRQDRSGGAGTDRGDNREGNGDNRIDRDLDFPFNSAQAGIGCKGVSHGTRSGGADEGGIPGTVNAVERSGGQERGYGIL